MKPEEDPEKKPSGCGVLVVYTGLLRRRIWPKKTATENLKTNNGASSKRRRAGSDEASFLPPPSNLPESAGKTIVTKSPVSPTKTAPTSHLQKIVRKPVDVVSSDTTNLSPKKSNLSRKKPGPRVQKDMTISGELESVIQDHQTTKGSDSLVRASSSNMMVFGHLGNIRQPGNTGRPHNKSNSNNVLDYLPMTAREKATINNNNAVMGNIVKKVNGKEKVINANEKEENAMVKAETGVLCRALSKRLDPEELKAMGNEEYKKGQFAEALALYDRAIFLDPDKASYRSNKSAALIGLGRLLEAVFECREAIQIEPSYCRAHHRLATLYLRLGEPEKAMTHYKKSGSEANPNDIAQAHSLQTCLTKCSEARKLRDWNTILKESGCAISSGADSSPQVFSSQAEALLKLQRHQDAETTLASAPVFELEASTMFFGAPSNAYFLLIRAQVHIAAGRFDEAVATAQRAARLDSNNKEVSTVVRRARAVASARSTGNELFKASNYAEACTAYGEGLEHDPFNAILLCNRAACRSKLGQWEKAIEDCNNALNVRPSYSKARLRRADCNAKLERWEASVKDYEALIGETPGEEVARALFEAQVHLKKDRGEEDKEMKFGEDMIVINSTDRFREFVTSPGMSVVLFSNKSTMSLPFVDQLCKKYPSVNFLKVDIDDNPYIGKMEGIASLPAFKIYKNGSKVKDIAGTNQDLLESSLKFFSN